MAYTPPSHPLQILQTIELEEAVKPGDPRFVETEVARGSPRTIERLAKKFGLDIYSHDFFPASKRHVLLFGHIGSGKSTSMLHASERLHAGNKLYVITVDVLNDLDRNNLHYADALMAVTRQLTAQLQEKHIAIDRSALSKLENWFHERVETEDHMKELVAQINTETKLKGGIPFLAELFASFTAAAKTNATYKDTLRHVVRNTFTQFADAFNTFLKQTETTLKLQGYGERILFIVDGTDKLTGDDTNRFFVDDVQQLLAIEALVLYTAPLSLKYDGIPSKLDDFVLPMIKLYNRDGTPHQPGRDAMRDILLKRANATVFASADLPDRLVDFSGGHPRELLRLLRLCCEFAEGRTIDAAAVDRAIDALASEYRRFLEPDDYALLAQMAAESEVHGGNNERTRRLLYRLALLEYNDGSWRCPHPAVKLLDGYKKAAEAAAS
jgi:hypothetical protein